MSPLAASLAGVARLMLALLEPEVSNRGCSYVFCDTDSMAVIATEHGGIGPSLGGVHPLPDGTSAIKALGWQDVDAIVEQVSTLNPYDRSVVPGSVLKVEDINRGPESGERRQLWCYAISAKRHALFMGDTDGAPEIIDDGYS